MNLHRTINKFLIAFLLLVTVPAFAFNMSSCVGTGAGLGFDPVLGITCNNPLGASTNHVIAFNTISVSVGTLSLGTKSVTVTGLTGIKANDVCVVSLSATQGITAGLVLSGCRASADGQVDILFSTPIVVGVSVGTISVNIADVG